MDLSNVSKLPWAASESSSMNESDHDPCYVYPVELINIQFWLVTVLGSIVAGISVLGNAILLYLFLTRLFFRRTYFFYFSILAVFDLFHSLAYAAVFSICVYYEYMKDLRVMRLWYAYVVPVTAVADVVRTTSVYILVAACIERYLYAHDLGGFCSNRKRTGALLAFALMAVLIRGTIFFELKIVDRTGYCSGLAEYIMDQTEIMTYGSHYQVIWSFWVRSILGTFCPFILLTLFNIAVVLQDRCTCLKVDHDKESGAKIVRLEYQRIGARRGGLSDLNAPEKVNSKGGLREEIRAVGRKTDHWISKAKARVRKAATRTLIVIVFEYLLCNGMGTALAAWEQFHPDSLYSMDSFYTLASGNYIYSSPNIIHSHSNLPGHCLLCSSLKGVNRDFVSLLSVVSCAIRLPTYWLCDVTFRKELRWVFFARPRRLLSVQRRRERPSVPSMSQVVANLINEKEGAKLVVSAVRETKRQDSADTHASGELAEQLLFSQAEFEESYQREVDAAQREEEEELARAESMGGFRGLAARAVALQKAEEGRAAAYNRLPDPQAPPLARPKGLLRLLRRGPSVESLELQPGPSFRPNFAHIL